MRRQWLISKGETDMKAMREAYGEALVELGRTNPNVLVLDADLSAATRSALFKDAYPERFFNVGVAEGNMVSIAAGMASSGKIPFVNTFAVFLALRAGDPVRSLVAYNKLNVKLAGACGGLSDSYDGASHQSVEDVAVMRAIPNMTVIVPADEHAARKAVFASIKRQQFSVGMSLIEPGKIHEEHKHDGNEELIVVMGGEGMAKIAGREFAVGYGSVIAIDPGEYHGFVNTGHQPLILLWIYDPPGAESKFVTRVPKEGMA
jgi:transketolase C-terminal domain/subunit